METPSSMRRVTRSQTSSSMSSCKQEESLPRSRTPALLDITNDSPIVGLAMGNLAEKTPSSSAVKSRVRATPGSGEALLRGQVKTLLQKVEEEAELVNKIGSTDFPFRVMLGLPVVPSPTNLLAPTPANTPQILSLSESKADAAQVFDSKITTPQVVGASSELEECLINRALLFDSPGKSEVSDGSTISSSVTYQGSEISSFPVRSPDDDNSSAWSMQVNASVKDEDDVEEIEDFEEEKEEEEEDDGGDVFDDLCEGLSKMSMGEEVRLPEFEGKHTRFVYNSDDEIEGEEEVEENSKAALSPSVLLLKGLPVPEGKHLRFHDEEEEE